MRIHLLIGRLAVFAITAACARPMDQIAIPTISTLYELTEMTLQF
jgi:hypothetical protein